MSLQPSDPPAVPGAAHKAIRPESVSWGLGSAPTLPPQVLLRSQLVGTEEGSHGKQQGCWHLLVAEKQKAKQLKQGAGRSKAKPGCLAQMEGRQWGTRDAQPHHSGRDGHEKQGPLTGLGRETACRHHSIQQREVPQMGFVGHVPATACRDQPFCRKSTSLEADCNFQ